ncbi:hypothetical protein PWT90_02444 [Aphanocladium album]|nr:hypothetical protein PWT90_02444 [Aphanocladium album]
MLVFTPIILATIVAARVQDAKAGLISREVLSSMTLGQANDVCGGKQTVHCCNDEAEKHSKNDSKGILSGLLNGILGNDGLYLSGQCAPIDVTLIGANQLLNHHCAGKVACCDRSGNDIHGGLVNVGLPCVALGSLIN